jgi:hypothetical protein
MSHWTLPILPNYGKVAEQALCRMHKIDLISDSLYNYEEKTPRPYGRASGELLVADMGEQEKEVEWCHSCAALCPDLGWPILCTTARTSKP